MILIWRRDLRPMLSNLPLVVGVLGFLFLIAAAVVGPSLATFDPQAWRLVEFGPDGSIAVAPIPPNSQHILGTDPMGRDLLSRLLWGARLTLTAVGLAVVGRILLGVTTGLLAAAFPGSLIRSTILAFSAAISGVPQLLLALLLVLLLRDWGFLGFVTALVAIGWADLAQFTYAEAVRLRRSEHVRAAIALGGSRIHIYWSHVLRNLFATLASLIPLEAGSALVVLAELGFIGFFVSGGTFFVDDFGKPILPVRDRTPEWGQMLAGARGYTFANQWVAFVPAVVVAAAVVVLNFLGEGVRAAADPHGTHRVSPRVLGWLGRGAALVVVATAAGFFQLAVNSSGLAVEDARARALEVAQRSESSAQLIAQVVRFSSERHALARPEQLNFYYATPRGGLRVGYIDADAAGLDVQWFEDQDNLLIDRLVPLALPRASWQDALAQAERVAGTRFRNANTGYLVSVVLVQTPTEPRYFVNYYPPRSPTPALIIPVGPDGVHERSSPTYLDDALDRARGVLGADATLWVAGALGEQTASGGPVVSTWMFNYGDGRGRFLLLNYEVDASGLVPSLFEVPTPLVRVPFQIPESAPPLGETTGLDDGMAKLGQHAVEALEDPAPFAVAMFADSRGVRQLRGVYQVAGTARRLSLDLASGVVTASP